MSRSRSESGRDADPLRPSDHIDGADEADAVGSVDAKDAASAVTSPRLGPLGWARWAWRQLTSMRTALILLLLLAIAAVPGSIVPQRTADPNGVTQYQTDHPDLFPILDKLQLFDVYSSAWFSAIYLLLFISLIGCVIPRLKHHWKAMRALPPRTPARLSRLDDHRAATLTLADGVDATTAAADAIDAAERMLRGARYRVHRYDGRGSYSVSAERGYLRETGNLLFHIALVGVLIAVGVGGAFTYTGQRVIVQGTTFVNQLQDYSSFNPGRFVDGNALDPFSLTLDKFDVTYTPASDTGAGQAGDFVAHLTTKTEGGSAQQDEVRVNHPLEVAGDRVYLMGNGYAPTIIVRDSAGKVIYNESVPFLPQDNNMTSLGVVKIPDGLPQQLGLVGFFYPMMQPLTTGAFSSVYPDLIYPVLTLNVYAGDLGINDGTPRSVYTLDPTGMTQLTGGTTGVNSLELMPGQTAKLPNDWGTVTFVNEADPSASTLVTGSLDASKTMQAVGTDYSASVKRFVSLSIHHDASSVWVLVFAGLAVAGLLAALFVPRRRMWVRVTPKDGALRLEYAGLARGEDPAIAVAVTQLAERHAKSVAKAAKTAPQASTDASDAPAGDDATPGEAHNGRA
ncbi:cytochrome c biogenesis protein ResB [Microbacterium sp. 4NA327F11]|uniref:cytochrome c biogenesis protein ResB n=1 Tax=Microbacterium sp. 4NA327F11 TaxID=2502229 RepID=UPI0014859C36|nr:cytochrome c biogenesis protein ResB [Microbacterium sp. 4NA327F11]